MALNPERRKQLENLLPEGVPVTRKWLMGHSFLDKHAIDNLIKSEQLRLLYKGVYIRGNVPLSWQSIVHALQVFMQTDYLVGGLSALALKGYAHYLPVSETSTIHLYGNDKLPAWINSILVNTSFVRHSRRELFEAMNQQKALVYTSTIPWKDGMKDLLISCPEKACLEMLNEVPDKISFEHADQLVQGMTSLSPRTLQILLEQCSNVKVKRLFLWLGMHHNHTWYGKLRTEKIDTGSGNRVIVKGGELDPTYKITVPKSIQV